MVVEIFVRSVDDGQQSGADVQKEEDIQDINTTAGRMSRRRHCEDQ